MTRYLEDMIGQWTKINSTSLWRQKQPLTECWPDRCPRSRWPVARKCSWYFSFTSSHGNFSPVEHPWGDNDGSNHNFNIKFYIKFRGINELLTFCTPNFQLSFSSTYFQIFTSVFKVISHTYKFFGVFIYFLSTYLQTYSSRIIYYKCWLWVFIIILFLILSPKFLQIKL